MDAILTPAGVTTTVVIFLGAGYVVACVLLRAPEDTVLLAQVRALSWLYVRAFHRMESNLGRGDPVPPEGPAILVANHRSGVDPLFVALLTKRRVYFLMAREYYELPGLKWIFKGLRCIPVNRDGTDLGATKAALKLLHEGKVLGIFPQGGIREPDDQLDEGKSGVALLALKTGAPVVPFYIANSPAHDSVLRSFFTCSRTRVYCGRPFHLTHDGPGKPSRGELDALARTVLESIAGQKPPSCDVEPPANVERFSKNRLTG